MASLKGMDHELHDVQNCQPARQKLGTLPQVASLHSVYVCIPGPLDTASVESSESLSDHVPCESGKDDMGTTTCDTHVFSVLKNRLRQDCQALALTNTDGRLTMTLLIRALARTITSVLRRGSWRTAFWDLGLTGVKACLSDRVLEKIQTTGRPCVASMLPTFAELQAVFPARSVLPIDDIFGWFIAANNATARVPPVVVAAVAQHTVAAVDPLRLWVGRTRSSSSLAAAEPEPEAPAWPASEMTSAAPMGSATAAPSGASRAPVAALAAASSAVVLSATAAVTEAVADAAPARPVNPPDAAAVEP